MHQAAFLHHCSKEVGHDAGCSRTNGTYTTHCGCLVQTEAFIIWCFVIQNAVRVERACPRCSTACQTLHQHTAGELSWSRFTDGCSPTECTEAERRIQHDSTESEWDEACGRCSQPISHHCQLPEHNNQSRVHTLLIHLQTWLSGADGTGSVHANPAPRHLLVPYATTCTAHTASVQISEQSVVSQIRNGPTCIHHMQTQASPARLLRSNEAFVISGISLHV